MFLSFENRCWGLFSIGISVTAVRDYPPPTALFRKRGVGQNRSLYMDCCYLLSRAFQSETRRRAAD